MEKLSNKTKAQLLDIIDRKDAVERSLRDINNTLNNKIEELKQLNKDNVQRFNNLKNDMNGTVKVLNKTREEHNILKNDYENICDILATERVENKNKLRKLQIINFISVIIILIIIFISLL